MALPLLAQDHPQKASPFDAIRWVNDHPEVQVQDRWFRPLKIDGVSVSELLVAADKRWPGQRQKRFAEDLMEIMALLDHSAGHEVSLTLDPLDGGSELHLNAVPNTLGKRQSLRDANRNLSGRNKKLTKAQALADIDEFQNRLTDQFAYLSWKGVDLQAEITPLKISLSDSVEASDLANKLHQILMKFGDGHASVSGSGYSLGNKGPFLPFLIADTGNEFLAIKEDRSGFVDSEYPRLVALDGVPVEKWLEKVRKYVVSGSPQLVRARSIRLLRDLSLWRAADHKAPLKMEVATVKGNRARQLQISVTSRKPVYGDWPRTESRLLASNVGYLRLASMDDEAEAEVYRWMPEFRTTRGLIVDVRGNGGGSRKALLALAGFFLGPSEPPWVGNIAAYKLSQRFDGRHLEARYMYPADHPGWNGAQLEAIQRAEGGFVPEWKIPSGFSPWHYMILDRTGHPDEYFYSKPIVILSDADCFSATDIFLGALGMHPRIQLLGSASGGGSARSQRFVLKHSGLRVQCASMASFRANGILYDGRGVDVHRNIAPDATYFLHQGKDLVLEHALRVIHE